MFTLKISVCAPHLPHEGTLMFLELLDADDRDGTAVGQRTVVCLRSLVIWIDLHGDTDMAGIVHAVRSADTYNEGAIVIQVKQPVVLEMHSCKIPVRHGLFRSAGARKNLGDFCLVGADDADVLFGIDRMVNGVNHVLDHHQPLQFNSILGHVCFDTL